MNCICDCLEEILGFSGLDEYTRFVQYINKLEKEGVLKPIPPNMKYLKKVVVPYGQWYQCPVCNTVWQLNEPDPPFPGYFIKIDVIHNTSIDVIE